MIMQVHDELVLEVDEGSIDSVREEVVIAMMSDAAAELSVPLKGGRRRGRRTGTRRTSQARCPHVVESALIKTS